MKIKQLVWDENESESFKFGKFYFWFDIDEVATNVYRTYLFYSSEGKTYTLDKYDYYVPISDCYTINDAKQAAQEHFESMIKEFIEDDLEWEQPEIHGMSEGYLRDHMLFVNGKYKYAIDGAKNNYNIYKVAYILDYEVVCIKEWYKSLEEAKQRVQQLVEEESDDE